MGKQIGCGLTSSEGTTGLIGKIKKESFFFRMDDVMRSNSSFLTELTIGTKRQSKRETAHLRLTPLSLSLDLISSLVLTNRLFSLPLFLHFYASFVSLSLILILYHSATALSTSLKHLLSHLLEFFFLSLSSSQPLLSLAK